MNGRSYLLSLPLLFWCASVLASEPAWPSVHREHREAVRVAPTFGVAATSGETPSRIELSRRVFGWIPYWERNGVSALSLARMDTAAWFSYEVIPSTGGYSTTRDWLTEPLLDQAVAAGARLVLTVTNFGFTNNSTLLNNPTAREQLIQNLIDLVRQRNASGINIDFENVSAAEADELVLFLSTLTSRLHAEVPGSEVSVALPARDWSGAFHGASISNAVDVGIIMGYAYRVNGSSSAGPVAPIRDSSQWGGLSLESSIQEYLDEGFAREKLVLGLPTYGVRWPTVSTQPGAATDGTGQAIFYGSVASTTFPSLAAEAVADRRVDTLVGWDASASTPYYIYTDNPGDPTQAQAYQGWFEDTDSLNEKMALADSYDLAGIAFWAVGYEDFRPELWDLIEERYGSTTPRWETRSLPGILYDVTFDGRRFIAVGASGAIWLSADGLDWTPQSTPTTLPLVGVASSTAGDVVAVGVGGTILSSREDGPWEMVPSPVSGILRAVTYGEAGWVAVGDNGVILHSPEGSTWTVVSPAGLTTTVLDVAESDGRYVAVTVEGTALTSLDGISWSEEVDVVSSSSLYAVTNVEGTFVASGSNSVIARSVDGLTWVRSPLWKPSTLTAIGTNWEGLTAVGASGRIIASRDGDGWYPQDSGSSAFLQAITYGKNTIVAVASDGTIFRRLARTPYLAWAQSEEEAHGYDPGTLYDFHSDPDHDRLPAGIEQLFSDQGYSSGTPDTSPFVPRMTETHWELAHPPFDETSNLSLSFEASVDGQTWWRPDDADLPADLTGFAWERLPDGSGYVSIPLSGSRAFVRWVLVERLEPLCISCE